MAVHNLITNIYRDWKNKDIKLRHKIEDNWDV